MKESQEDIGHDLEYYQSGIRQLYVRHYQVYVMMLLAIMSVTVVGIGSFDSLLRGLFIVLFLVEVGLAVYLLRYLRADSFDTYFQRIKLKLPEEFQKMAAIEVQEDDQAYYFLDNQDLFVKLKKKNTRNFPSKMRNYTLLVGFTSEVDEQMLEQPLYLFYYDITQIKYSENYKKEIVKNTNFIAKRNKRRLKSAIMTIIVLGILAAFLYQAGQTYF